MFEKHDEHNKSIECIVSECRHHCKKDDYCTLNKIRVVKHEANADTTEATDCGSFEMQ